MQLFIGILFVFLSIVVPDVGYTSGDLEYIREMSHTYGFCIGQRYSLKIIEDKFPSLKQKVLIAKYKFDDKFKSSFEEIEKFLKLIFKKKWDGYKKEMTSKIKSGVNPSQITKEQAILFLKQVETRSTGDIETPVIQTLLTFHPLFKKQPEQEFLMNFKNTYKTKNHPKAKKLDIQIEYPKSWESREGKRPHIVQFFRSQNGHGIVMMSLQINPLPKEVTNNLSEEEMSNLFDEKSEIEAMAPKGSKVLDSKSIILDNQKGGLLILEIDKQRLDLKQKMLSHQYMTIYNNNFIILNIGVRDTIGNDDALVKAYERHKKLFWLIANSLIIKNQYF
jgi:hypothetical protein